MKLNVLMEAMMLLQEQKLAGKQFHDIVIKHPHVRVGFEAEFTHKKYKKGETVQYTIPASVDEARQEEWWDEEYFQQFVDSRVGKANQLYDARKKWLDSGEKAHRAKYINMVVAEMDLNSLQTIYYSINNEDDFQSDLHEMRRKVAKEFSRYNNPIDIEAIIMADLGSRWIYKFAPYGLGEKLDHQRDIIENEYWIANTAQLMLAMGRDLDTKQRPEDVIGAEFTKETGFDITVFHAYHQETKSPREWYLEPDASTEWEIVSPAKDVLTTIENMKKVFAYIRKVGYTTERDAFHVSISIDTKGYSDYNLLKMALILGGESILKQFGREMNRDYAKNQMHAIRAAIEDGTEMYHLKSMMQDDKVFKAVTEKLTANIWHDRTSSFNIGKLRSEGLVEFRMMGNEDYELREQEIELNILRYAAAMVLATTDEKDDQFRRLVYRELVKKVPDDPLKKPAPQRYADLGAMIRKSPTLRLVGNVGSAQAQWKWLRNETMRLQPASYFAQDIKDLPYQIHEPFVMFGGRQANYANEFVCLVYALLHHTKNTTTERMLAKQLLRQYVHYVTVHTGLQLPNALNFARTTVNVIKESWDFEPMFETGKIEKPNWNFAFNWFLHQYSKDLEGITFAGPGLSD